MAIQAISSVTNKGYSNISFGKRGEKPAKNHNVTSPMKAVPLAVLIAMSPLTTTNAENIMRAESNANTIELAEAPQSQVLIYGDVFKSRNGSEVTVMALNTKGGTDSFDQILLKVGDVTFEAKDLVDREIYLYKDNGDKEGPLNIKEVIGETELNGKKERFSFIDPNIVNYVEAVVAQPTNQSNIKSVRKDHSNLIIANSKGDLLFVTDEYLKNELFRKAQRVFKDKSSAIGVPYAKKFVQAEELKDLAMYQEGRYGNYKIRFFDIDDDKSNYETITIQKDGENEFFVTGVTHIAGKIHGVDDAVDFGSIYAIRLKDDIFSIMAKEKQKPLMITDDEIALVLVNAIRSSKCNLSAGWISVSDHESNLALGDE